MISCHLLADRLFQCSISFHNEALSSFDILSVGFSRNLFCKNNSLVNSPWVYTTLLSPFMTSERQDSSKNWAYASRRIGEVSERSYNQLWVITSSLWWGTNLSQMIRRLLWRWEVQDLMVRRHSGFNPSWSSVKLHDGGWTEGCASRRHPSLHQNAPLHFCCICSLYVCVVSNSRTPTRQHRVTSPNISSYSILRSH